MKNNRRVSCRLAYFFLLLLYSPSAFTDDLFDGRSYGYQFNTVYFEKTSVGCALDYNGDGYPDFLLDERRAPDSLNGNIYISINQKDSLFFKLGSRNSVVLNEVLGDDPFAYATIPSNPQTPVFVSQEMMKIVQYLDDESVPLFDRHTIYSSSLKLDVREPAFKNFTHINKIAIADVIGPFNDHRYADLLVAAQADDGDARLFVYNNPFEIIADRSEPLPPMQTVSLPGAPTKLWAGHIDGDEKADIFFECDGVWRIWLAKEHDGGFEPNDPSRSFTIPIPNGVKRAVDVGCGVQGYRLFVSVESEPYSDTAYVAFPNGQLDRPVSVEIPGKRLQGGATRMFQYQKGSPTTWHPLFIVYDPLDEQNLQDNSFYIYKEDVRHMPSDEPLNPQLVQVFQPDDPNDPNHNIHFYLDRPEMLADFDKDGAPDLVFKSFCRFAESEDSRYTFLGFAGLGETSIPDWSVYE